MSESADIAARTQRFSQAVRDFKLPAPSRHAKLMPLKDGIIELRQKGAPLRLVRELLATVGVAVGTDTIARFLEEVTGDSEPTRASRRSTRARRVVARSVRVQPADVSSAAVPPTPNSLPSSSSVATANVDKLPERSRTRGPRIADPRNL